MTPSGSRITIGLVTDIFADWGESDCYQTYIIRGIDDTCRDRDVNLLVFVTGHLDSTIGWESASGAIYGLISDRVVDGLIVLPSAIGVHAPRESLERKVRSFGGLPLITLGDRFEGIPSVLMDNRAGMKAVVDHLIEVHGKRRIAFIRGIKGNADAEERYGAYLSSLADHDIDFDPSLVAQGNYLIKSGAEAIRSLIGATFKADAIVAANDNMAIGAISELRRHGLQSLPVTGFDNVMASKFHSLTTVDQPFRVQGRVGAQVLLDRIAGRAVPAITRVPARFIWRNSCGCSHLAISTYLGTHTWTEGPPQEADRSLDGFEFHDVPPTVMEQARKRAAAISEILGSVDPTTAAMRLMPAWNDFVRWAIENGIGATDLIDLVSELWKAASALVPKERRAAELDPAILAMLSQMCVGVESRSAAIQYSQAVTTRGIEEFFQSLLQEIEIGRQMDLAFKSFPEFGIELCQIARYMEPARPEAGAKTLLAFAGKERFKAGEEFDTNLVFAPSCVEGIMGNRCSLVIESLHSGERQIGYSAIGMHEGAGRNARLLNARLSIGIEASLALEKLEDRVRARTGELMSANAKLSKNLAENDLLLREIEHRVKNNFNVVASILNLSSYGVEHEGARQVLVEAQARIHSMTAIYEQLYRKPEQSSVIELSSYITSLAKSLVDTYSVGAEKVSLLIDMNKLSIDMKRAVSLGLIVNELVSNALKYAWPEGEQGCLRVSLAQTENAYTLVVEDNGAGIDASALEGRNGNIGLTLVRMLVEDLDGELSISGASGTRVSLRFPA